MKKVYWNCLRNSALALAFTLLILGHLGVLSGPALVALGSTWVFATLVRLDVHYWRLPSTERCRH